MKNNRRSLAATHASNQGMQRDRGIATFLSSVYKPGWVLLARGG
jgi:hypothetical protein